MAQFAKLPVSYSLCPAAIWLKPETAMQLLIEIPPPFEDQLQIYHCDEYEWWTTFMLQFCQEKAQFSLTDNLGGFEQDLA